MAQAADTYYWGGGTTDIADNTTVPFTTNGLSGTWSDTTRNWASSPFSPNTYTAWVDGSVANFGYFTNAANVTVKLAASYTLGGLVVNALSGRSYDFYTNTSSPVNLTIGGPVNVLSGSAKFLRGVVLAGSSDLEKWGGGELQLRANSSNFTGNVAIREGQILLDSSNGSDRDGGIGQVTNISIVSALAAKTASTPILFYIARNGANDALNDNAVITLKRGQLTLQPSTNSTETAGRIEVQGAGILKLTDGAAGTSGTFTLGDATQGLTRVTNGTLHVVTAADGTMKTAVKVANAGTLAVDTLLPWISTSQGQFMKLDSANGNALTTVAADTADLNLANWTAYSSGTNNLRVTGALTGTLSANTAVNSLGFSAASTLNLGGNTLNVASGGLSSVSGTAVITNGSLTSDASAIYLNSGANSGGELTVGAAISGNVDVVKSGFSTATLSGTSSNTYTGTTYVNYGQLYLSKSGTAVAVPGDLVVRNGGAVLVRSTANSTNSQFGAASSVTLDNSYLKVEANALMAVGGTLTLDNGYLEVIYNNTATNMLRLTGAGTGFVFNGGVVQHNATIDGTMSLLTDIGYGAASATQARFETVATNGAKLNVALNWGANAGTATRTFDIADSTTLAAGEAEMRVDASLINGGSGTTAGALRKTGSGVLQLVASNSYTGGTTVEAGTLQISTLSRAAQSNLSGVVSGSTVTFLEPIAGSFVPGQVLNFNGTERVIWSVVDDYRVALSAAPTAGLYSNTITSSNFTRTGSIQGNVSINGGTLKIDNSDNTVGGNLVFGGGALEVGEGNTTDYASKILNSTGAIHIRTTNAQNVTLGALDASNTGGLRKTGEGTLTLSAVNAYTGNTSVEAGKLMVNGSIASSAVTVVTNAGTIGGSGTVGDLVIADGGTLAPGNSPGTLFAASATWTNGGSYDWEILDAIGSAGAIDGWDLLDVAGTLSLTGLSNSSFTINLITLSDSTTPGPMANFNSATNYSWMIARATTISSFNASLFQLYTGAFSNAYTGTFGITNGTYEGDQALFLTYTGGGEAIPEPGTWAASALLAATAGFMRWRRRR